MAKQLIFSAARTNEKAQSVILGAMAEKKQVTKK
jgi:hypothetical protein